MKKPKLLLSCSYRRSENYVSLFEAAGFTTSGGYLPSLYDSRFPFSSHGLPFVDGLVLCGGGDIDVSFLGEENRGSEPSDLIRDKIEFDAFEYYDSRKKPIFGICRGMQVINVALGGTLYQHLPTANTHRSESGSNLYHPVENVVGSLAYRLYGAGMLVNSAHHQACRTLGKGLSAIQRHADGTIEGVCGESIFAVQWHPERSAGRFDPVPLIRAFYELF